MIPIRRVQPKPKEKKNKCKIVIRKKGDRTEKTIENCSPQEAKILMEAGKLEEE